jgi:hypothetical protein
MTQPDAPPPPAPQPYYAPSAGYSAPYAPVPAGARFNTLAIVAFVLVFLASLGAVICGHIALSQIKQTGEGGHGLALAAVILGYVSIAITIVLVIVWLLFLLAVGVSSSAPVNLG